MVIYVDIDKTICSDYPYTLGADYSDVKPIISNIQKINGLYDAGNHIVYWTARGTTTGKDWSKLTKKQLIEWGVKYHELKFDKPFYDIFIDDKALRIEEVPNDPTYY
jgi:histidinol phosphatase-like enzyme